MRTLVFAAWLLNISQLWGYTLHHSKTEQIVPSVKRSVENSIVDNGVEQIGCIHMVSQPSHLVYISPGSHDVCALYMIGLPDQVVEIEFTDFTIGCEDGGLLAIVDGWETQGQFFPNTIDHPAAQEYQYRTYCGNQRSPPVSSVVLSQNVGLIQLRVPQPGQGYSISVRFIPNAQPCNIISLLSEGTYTLTNSGMEKNCSMSILSAEQVEVLAVSVGTMTTVTNGPAHNGITYKCEEQGLEDYLELRAGNGLDPFGMWRQTNLCGYGMNVQGTTFDLPCQNSVIRLVSSGRFHNSVTFRFQQIDAPRMQRLSSMIC